MNIKRIFLSIFLCGGAALVADLSGPARAQDGAVPLTEDGAQIGESRDDYRERQNILLEPLFERLKAAPDARAAQLLEQAVWQIWLRSGSDTVDLLVQQATKAMSAQQHEKALEVLDAVVELAPDYPEGWNKRATVLYLLDRYDESMRDIVRVLELEPRHFGALSGIGLIRRELGDNDKALAAFRQALEIHPFLPGALRAVEDLRESVEGQGI